MRWLVIAIAVTGCRQVFGIGDPTLASDALGDDAADSAEDGNDDLCFGSPYRVCLAALPSAPLTLSGVLDTDNDTRCMPFTTPNTDVTGCVVAGTTITFNDFGPTGSRPLVVVSTTDVMIPGGVIVDSRISARVGPGANPAQCGGGAVAPTGGGGGFGGTFGGVGGEGGADQIGAGDGKPEAATQRFGGGCAGSDGAGATTHGAGGAGGGALLIIAVGMVQIDGLINASGASGSGAMTGGGGGGGGGAGGMIALEAPAIVLAATGQLFANGGAGGEGSAGNAGAPGTDSTSATVGAHGGSGGSSAGDGGDGSLGARLDGATGGAGLIGVAPNGGGGGGGGAGRIVIAGASLQLIGPISPPNS